MPIFEYSCTECGLRFEKLVRKAEGGGELCCPSCGSGQLRKEFSTFSAHSGAGKGEASAPMCPSGGVCPTPGACGLN
ncbi:MAG: FmdB family zinc ribbon protein [Acidobacteriota bacterium]